MPPQAYDPSVQTVVNSNTPTNTPMDPYYHHHQQQAAAQAAAAQMYSSYPAAYAPPAYNGHTGYPQQQPQLQQQQPNCAPHGWGGYNPYDGQGAVPAAAMGAPAGMVPVGFGAPPQPPMNGTVAPGADPTNYGVDAAAAAAAGYEVILPHENDVLMGRGGKNNQHIGNERLRDMARSVRDRYKASSKKGKSNMSRELVQKVRTELEPPGRFLKRNPVTSEWEDVGDEIAREKVSQVLRDAVSEWTGPKAQAKQEKEQQEQQEMEGAEESEEEEDGSAKKKNKRALSSRSIDTSSSPPSSSSLKAKAAKGKPSTPPTTPPRATSKNNARRSRSNSPANQQKGGPKSPKTTAAPTIPTTATQPSPSLPVPAAVSARAVTETTTNVSAARKATTTTTPTTTATSMQSATTTSSKSPPPPPQTMILAPPAVGGRSRANTAESEISLDDVSFAPSDTDLDDTASLGGMGLGMGLGGLGGLEEHDEEDDDEENEEGKDRSSKTNNTGNSDESSMNTSSVTSSNTTNSSAAAPQLQQRKTKAFRRMPPGAASAGGIPGVVGHVPYSSFRNKSKQRKTNMLERYSNMGMGVSDMSIQSITSELSSRSLMNGTQLSSRQLMATGARQMSNRQLSNRQLSTRQLSSRQLSNRQLSSRQLSSRQLSSRTLSSRQLSSRQLSRRGLMSSAMMGESELSLDSLSICDDYSITSAATGANKQLSRKNVFMEQYMSMDMGLSDFSLGSLPEGGAGGGVDLDFGGLGASFAGGASSARLARPSVIIEGDLLEEISEHSGMDSTIKPNELLDMYAATGVGNSISNMTMNTLGTFSGHSRSMGMSMTGTSSRGLYASSGKAGTGNSMRIESGHSFIGDAANDLQLDMLDDDLFDEYDYMDDADEFSSEFC